MAVRAKKAKVGRPVGFDKEAALEAAMRVFWSKGFEGATLADLTEAMGVNRSSMYTIFGDKEELFRLAIARYSAGPASYLHAALQRQTARAVAEALLKGALDLLRNPEHPRGCLTIQGALACGTNSEPARDALIEWRTKGEAAIRKRFERAQAEGDLAKDLDAGDLSRYLGTLVAGLAVQAANGASANQLSRVVSVAIRSLPF